MIRADFIILAIAMVAPFVAVSILADMTKKAAVAVVIFIALAGICYLSTFTATGARGARWLETEHHMGLLVVAVFCCCLVAALSIFLAEMKKQASLMWPPSIDQRGLERIGTRYLGRAGWDVELGVAQAGYSIFRCRKSTSLLYIMLLRDNSFLWRVLEHVRSATGWSKHKLVIVTYDCITEGMVEAAKSANIPIINYKSLEEIDSYQNIS